MGIPVCQNVIPFPYDLNDDNGWELYENYEAWMADNLEDIDVTDFVDPNPP